MNTYAAEVRAAVGFEFAHETFTAAVDAPKSSIKLAEHSWESTEFGHAGVGAQSTTLSGVGRRSRGIGRDLRYCGTGVFRLQLI